MALPVEHTYFLDGSFYLVKLNGFNTSNRALKFGDFIFETVRTRSSQALLFDYHYERLLTGMKELKMETTNLPSKTQLHKFIEQLINKNRYYTDCRVRITVYRRGEGLYTPQIDDVSVLIEAAPIDKKGYEYNEKGLIIDLYDENVKCKSPISNYKTGQSLVSVLASHYKKSNLLDDVLIFNSDHRIIEASSSNVFWIKGSTYFTPKLSSGCVDGVMRRKVIELIKKDGFELIETDGTTLDLLLWADEIFLTNAVVGIQGVVGIKKVRYYLTRGKALSLKLNEWYKSAK